jgi:branched-chain amino acid transport system ATP-binding protein
MSAILETRDLCKTFGAVTAAAGISAAFDPDAIVGLIGTNGAGKTTFVNIVTGYVKPTTGRVLFAGRDITDLAPRAITRLGICRSFQIPQLYNSLSVHENLLIGLGVVLRNAGAPLFGAWRRPVPGHGACAAEVAEAMSARFGLSAWRDQPASALPEGVRKLLDIAMALVMKPRILLLDEPTSGVAQDEKFAIMDTVVEAARADGVTVMFVEHDMEIVQRYAARVLAFYDGRVIADGVPAKVLGDAEVCRHVTGESRARA